MNQPEQTVKSVPEYLSCHKRYAKLERRSSERSSTEFLGSLTSPEAMEMNPEKSRAWPRQRQLLGSSVLLASLTFITN